MAETCAVGWRESQFHLLTVSLLVFCAIYVDLIEKITPEGWVVDQNERTAEGDWSERYTSLCNSKRYQMLMVFCFRFGYIMKNEFCFDSVIFQFKIRTISA